MLRGVQLFLGETNRTISETPMNMASSRSHCIFTLHVDSRQVTTHSACILKAPVPDTAPVLMWFCQKAS